MAESIAPAQGTSGKTVNFELRGIDYVPDEERQSTPANLFWVFVGAQLTFGVMILGWLPIVFGLDFWSAVTAVTLGTVLGAVMFGLFSLFGPRTGTNSAVSTGACYGVNGRLLGSFKAIFIGVGYLALTVWVCGDMVAAGVARIAGGETSDVLRAVSYLVIMGALIIIAVVGHDLLVKLQKYVIPLVLFGFAMMVVTTFSNFGSALDAQTSTLAPSEYWMAWVATFVVAMQLPVSYMPFANGFTRYISRKKWSDRAVFLGISAGVTLGVLIVLFAGIYISTLFAIDQASFGDGVVGVVPAWFVLPLIVIALIGAFDQGGFALYGAGLDTSSVVPSLKRLPATVILSVVSLLLVFLGSFVWDAVLIVSGFVTIIAVFVLPWAAVGFTHFVLQKGRLWPLDLQVFETGVRGGAYWYKGGWNWRSTAAYLIGVLVALLFVRSDVYNGPLADAFGGADLSMFVSAVVAVLLYMVFRLISAEKIEVPAEGDVPLASPTLKNAFPLSGPE
jgi:purine-cytosine permease-like protein